MASNSHQNVTTTTRKENNAKRKTTTTRTTTTTTRELNEANRGELLRDYLRRCLYDKSTGYFNQNGQSPIGKIGVDSGEASLHFHLMADKEEYTETLAQKWTQLGKQWLTPAEIFKPHYANAIARYLIEETKKNHTASLKVIELGGGAGTAAVGILNYLRANEPQIYAVSYTHLTLPTKA